jgi:hypothetical protein
MERLAPVELELGLTRETLHEIRELLSRRDST